MLQGRKEGLRRLFHKFPSVEQKCAKMSPHQLKKCLAKMEVQSLTPGQHLVTQDSLVSACWLVITGVLCQYKPNIVTTKQVLADSFIPGQMGTQAFGQGKIIRFFTPKNF
jgi:CRP-like cAMP-binding protein